MWNETVLLTIKRQFTENEAVAFVLKELSDAKVELGKLQSEIAYLKDENKRIDKERSHYKTSLDIIKSNFRIKFRPISIIPKRKLNEFR